MVIHHNDFLALLLRGRDNLVIANAAVNSEDDLHLVRGSAEGTLAQAVRVVEAMRQVVVNLAGVNFIDSTGLATLVQGMKHCRQEKGDLRLCGLQQPVRIIFELTRLDKAFEILTDEESAVNSFAS